MASRPTQTVHSVWTGGVRYLHRSEDGHEVATDAPLEPGRPYDGFKPSLLLLAALAGCTGVDLAEILRKQRQAVTGIEIRVTGVQEPDPPWPYVEIRLEFTVRGRNLRREAVERAVALAEEKYCSVSATVRGTARILRTVRLVEETGEEG